MNSNLFHENQFGFQTNNSTEHAILQFTRNFAQNFDNGKFISGAFNDLLKAFDTVHHQLKCLKYYTVNENNRLQSYLFQRTQYTKNNNDIKYLLETDCGVPQGSTLGSSIFIYFYFASKFENVILAYDANLGGKKYRRTVSANE